MDPLELEDDTYDVIILGTGITQSLLSAALSRVGKKILHLDENIFYGEKTSSFGLDGFMEWIEAGKETRKAVQKFDEKPEQARFYSIDLFPKLYLAAGPEIKLLVSSGVSRYLEFKAGESSYISAGGELHLVPCSKGELFKSKYVTLLEKRSLKKFFDSILEQPPQTTQDEPSTGESKRMSEEEKRSDSSIQEEPEARQNLTPKNNNNNNNNNNHTDVNSLSTDEEDSFLKYLKESNLSEKLRNIVLYAIGLLSEKTPRLSRQEGLEKLKKYISSIGVYAPSPFLVSLYGFAELPQAFCRLSAVYGSTFVLRQTPTAIGISSENTFESITLSSKQIIKAKTLISSPSYLQQHGLENLDLDTITVSRGVAIIDRSLIPAQNTVVAIFPPGEFGNPNTIFLNQFGHDSQMAPKTKYLLHLSCIGSDGQTYLEKALEAVTEHNSQAQVLYRAFFQQQIDQTTPKTGSKLPSQVYCVSDPPFGNDFEANIREAESIFYNICGKSQVFLPTVPDPDNFVWENTEEK